MSLLTANRSKLREAEFDKDNLWSRYNNRRTDGWTFPPKIEFGWHREHKSPQMEVSDDGREAIKFEPQIVYSKGMAYSELPLKGHSEFEVEISGYGTSWSGNLKIGVTQCPEGEFLDHVIPRYSPDATDHLVWCASKIHDHIRNIKEYPYGTSCTTLDDLRRGDRLGVQITPNGTLSFLVNGRNQGPAVLDAYVPGFDLYVMVDHYANCRATRVTRAVCRLDVTLEQLTMDAVASFLPTRDHVDGLPLPAKILDELRRYNFEDKKPRVVKHIEFKRF